MGTYDNKAFILIYGSEKDAAGKVGYCVESDNFTGTGIDQDGNPINIETYANTVCDNILPKKCSQPGGCQTTSGATIHVSDDEHRVECRKDGGLFDCCDTTHDKTLGKLVWSNLSQSFQCLSGHSLEGKSVVFSDTSGNTVTVDACSLITSHSTPRADYYSMSNGCFNLDDPVFEGKFKWGGWCHLDKMQLPGGVGAQKHNIWWEWGDKDCERDPREAHFPTDTPSTFNVGKNMCAYKFVPGTGYYCPEPPSTGIPHKCGDYIYDTCDKGQTTGPGPRFMCFNKDLVKTCPTSLQDVKEWCTNPKYARDKQIAVLFSRVDKHCNSSEMACPVIKGYNKCQFPADD